MLVTSSFNNARYIGCCRTSFQHVKKLLKKNLTKLLTSLSAPANMVTGEGIRWVLSKPNKAGAQGPTNYLRTTLKGVGSMSKYEVIHESEVKVINEQKAAVVQIQEGKVLPVLVISQLYPIDGNEWGFCSPRVSGAVSFRLAMTSKQIGWLVAELEKAQAVVEKAEKASVKSTTKKAPKAAVTKKAAVDDDLELEVSSSRTRRIRR